MIWEINYPSDKNCFLIELRCDLDEAVRWQSFLSCLMFEVFARMQAALAILIWGGRGSTLSPQGWRGGRPLWRGHFVDVKAARRIRVGPISTILQIVFASFQVFHIFFPERHFQIMFWQFFYNKTITNLFCSDEKYSQLSRNIKGLNVQLWYSQIQLELK